MLPPLGALPGQRLIGCLRLDADKAQLFVQGVPISEHLRLLAIDQGQAIKVALLTISGLFQGGHLTGVVVPLPARQNDSEGQGNPSAQAHTNAPGAGSSANDAATTNKATLKRAARAGL